MTIDFKLHHIGVATKNIEREFRVFEKLGYYTVSDIFIDEIQKIKGVFIEAPNQPPLELLENLTPDGPLNTCLEKGIKFYHYAYETNDIERDCDIFINQHRAKIIVPITTATYFEKICFMMLPNMMIVELVKLKCEG